MLTLIRRDPTPFPSVSRLMSSFMNEPFFADPHSANTGNLALDISEDEKTVIVRASLPGFARENIDVEIHDGVLTIKAERTDETEEKGENYFQRERRIGAVARSISLPSVVDDTQTAAELKDGVLTLRIPKSEKALPKKVKIG